MATEPKQPAPTPDPVPAQVPTESHNPRQAPKE